MQFLYLINIGTVLMVFILYIFLLLKNKYMFLSIPIFIPQFWAILSVIYIEHNSIYITEQERYAFLTGATSKLGVYLIILMLTIFGMTFLVSRILNNYPVRTLKIKITENYYLDRQKLKKLLVYLFITFAVLLVLDTGITRIIFKDQITRFNFDEKSILINILHLQIVYALTYPILFLLGRWYPESPNLRRSIWLIILLLCFAYLLRGEKFTPFYQMALYFFAAYFFTKPFKMNNMLSLFKLKRIAFMIVAAIISLLFVFQISNKYQEEFSLNTIDSLKYIEYRALGLQGHLWWGTDNLENQISSTEREQALNLEINSYFASHDDLQIYGIRHLMLFVSPVIGAQAIAQGINFTMGYPAILLYFFGYSKGILILILQGSLLSFYYLLLSKKLTGNNYLYTLLLLIIYSQINYYFIMGSFSLNITLLLAISILFILSFITKFSKKEGSY